ncbi:hypothetical protein DFS33DRAFT_1271280 [Desarmillaria ectypa]|nr:hypothetical protein DFS33DRAFT_1271280 [Desarmillaria ectypa]
MPDSRRAAKSDRFSHSALEGSLACRVHTSSFAPSNIFKGCSRYPGGTFFNPYVTLSMAIHESFQRRLGVIIFVVAFSVFFIVMCMRIFTVDLSGIPRSTRTPSLIRAWYCARMIEENRSSASLLSFWIKGISSSPEKWSRYLESVVLNRS